MHVIFTKLIKSHSVFVCSSEAACRIFDDFNLFLSLCRLRVSQDCGLFCAGILAICLTTIQEISKPQTNLLNLLSK